MSPPLADGMRRQLAETTHHVDGAWRPGGDFFPRRRSRRLRHLRGQIRQWFWGIQAPDGDGRHVSKTSRFARTATTRRAVSRRVRKRLRSKPSPDKAPIRLLLFNDTGADINLLSVDVDGQRTRRGTIGTDRSGSILSYVARPWIIMRTRRGHAWRSVWPGAAVHASSWCIPAKSATSRTERLRCAECQPREARRHCTGTSTASSAADRITIR